MPIDRVPDLESPDCKLWTTQDGDSPLPVLVVEGNETVYETRIYPLGEEQILIASKTRADGMVLMGYRIRSPGSNDKWWLGRFWVSPSRYRALVKLLEDKMRMNDIVVEPQVIPGAESEFLISQLVAKSGDPICTLEF